MPQYPQTPGRAVPIRRRRRNPLSGRHLRETLDSRPFRDVDERERPGALRVPPRRLSALRAAGQKSYDRCQKKVGTTSNWRPPSPCMKATLSSGPIVQWRLRSVSKPIPKYPP